MANRISSIFDFKSSGLSKVKADIAGVDGAWNKARTGFRSATEEFKQSRGAQLALVASAGAVAAKSIQAASDLEESINAVNVSYGQAAQGVHELGESSAESFGMSRRAFNQFAVQFSSFAKQIAGAEGRPVQDVLEEITTRVADFASVTDLDMARASEVFMSTMAGSAEVARQFGVDVGAATVETHLLNSGMVESKGAITEADKVLGRYQVLMSGTTHMAGDFKNTQDSLANSTRTLTGQVEDLSAMLGEGLLPAASATAATLTDVAPILEKQIELFGKFSTLVGTVTSDLTAAAKGPDAYAENNAKLVASLDELGKTADEVREKVLDLGGSEEEAEKAVAAWVETYGRRNDEMALGIEMERRAEAARARNAKSVGDAIELERRATAQKERLRVETERAADVFDDTDVELTQLYGTLDLFLNRLENERQIAALSEKLTEAASNADLTEQDIYSLRLEVARYGGEVAGLPTSVVTEIDAMIDEGAYAEAQRRLAILTAARFAPVTPVVNSRTGAPMAGPYHTGTTHATGGMARVSDSEIIDLPSGSRVYPPHVSERMMSANSGPTISFPNATFIGEPTDRALEQWADRMQQIMKGRI